MKIAFECAYDIKTFADIEVLNYSKTGSVANLIVKGNKQSVADILSKKNPLLLEIIPLSLEEFFTYELKERGYSFEEIIEEEEKAD